MDVIIRRRLQLSRCHFGNPITPLKPSIAIRIVEPEILDDLPAGNARAIASRRDLQRLNLWLGHRRMIARALQAALGSQTSPRVIEIGCGDATFATKALGRIPPGEITLVDQQAIMNRRTFDAFAEIGWKAWPVCADIFKWMPNQSPVDCIYTNLFLHHFQTEQLRSCFSLIAARTRVFIACEPHRWRPALIGSYILTYMTCSAVTRYDAPISVRAGFAGKELSSLWPAGNWDLQEKEAGISGHIFVATKKC